MSQDNGSATGLTAVGNGRPIKFTPERFEQIKNLVERGISREEIAGTIGVTLGSLQVTCSRVGISLRRARPPGSTPPARREPKPQPQLQPTTANNGHVTVALSHERRTLELKLPSDLLGCLALEAHLENLTLGDLISRLLTSALKGNNHEETSNAV
jgi:hypothetical protein